MSSVKINRLREIAGELQNESRQCEMQIQEVSECCRWIRTQEFKDGEKLFQICLKQQEKLLLQQRQMRNMAQTLQQICDVYEKTEQQIIASGISSGSIQRVDLRKLRDELTELGLHIEL